MEGKFLSGMAAGMFLGAAAGMMLMPKMDRRTRKRISRAGRSMVGSVADAWDGMKDMRR